MPVPTFVVDASVVVRWLVAGPWSDECSAFLDRRGALDARLLSPTCLYSDLVRSLPEYEVALVDYVRRSASGELALTPQWEQLPDGTVRDYRTDSYARGIALSYPSRRGSLFDMAYAALAEQAGTMMWTIDERFYSGARAMGLVFVMHPGRDPLP